MSLRPVKEVRQSQPTMEGAGVQLRRAFGFGSTSEFDPFLLLDDFRNDNPEAYLAGFPWHPHRGIETITYVLAGTVEHGDSLGNRGRMGAGDVQWMTAGRGILHQEMPKGDAQGRMHGFQLWSNLPASLKMTEPRYQDISARDIPEVTDDDGTKVRVVVGDFWGKKGPVEGSGGGSALPRHLRAAGHAEAVCRGSHPERVRVCVRGLGTFRDASEPRAVLTEPAGGDAPAQYEPDGKPVVGAVRPRGRGGGAGGGPGIRFLLVSGKPIEEPVAWHGPIVMNTQEELQQAFAELRAGTFIHP